MKAIALDGFGSPENFRGIDLPDPQPGEQDLLIEVRACALNPVDVKIRQGYLGPRKMPLVLGFDVSGVVRAMGKAVTGFSVGDEVYASPSLIRPGANAALVCVDHRTAAPKPASLDHVHAAALPLAVLTAWEALHDKARMHTGETVLIQAGAGGVGHLAIQLAKLHGCRVIATASRDESIALCGKLGADEVVNYQRQDLASRVNEITAGRGCDVVLDAWVIDGEFEQSARCVGAEGRLVTVLPPPATDLSGLFRLGASLHFEFMGVPTVLGIRPQRQGQTLRTVAELVDAGRLRPHVSHILPLDQLADAHRLIESHHTLGKIVLQVPPASTGGAGA